MGPGRAPDAGVVVRGEIQGPEGVVTERRDVILTGRLEGLLACTLSRLHTQQPLCGFGQSYHPL